jgi:undecaprenyl-diphosphatase
VDVSSVSMTPFVQAALLGIVQGLTEFLPLSSTAHLLIGARLLGYQDPGGVFTVMIQLGSILALMWLYRTKLAWMIAGLPTNPEARRFALVLLAACSPALLAGALFAKYVKTVLYGSFGVIAAAFVLGGIVLLLVERYRPVPTVREADRAPLSRAVGIGLCQMLALIPGVSRSGATMVGGLLMGLDRPAAAEFSFFLAMPTMMAAFAHDLLEVRNYLEPARAAHIAVGFVMAFVASALVVKPFLGFVKRSGFAPFAWYRIVAGLALLAAVAAGW